MKIVKQNRRLIALDTDIDHIIGHRENFVKRTIMSLIINDLMHGLYHKQFMKIPNRHTRWFEI